MRGTHARFLVDIVKAGENPSHLHTVFCVETVQVMLEFVGIEHPVGGRPHRRPHEAPGRRGLQSMQKKQSRLRLKACKDAVPIGRLKRLGPIRDEDGLFLPLHVETVL